MNELYVKVFERTYYKTELEAMSVNELTDVLNQIPIAIDSCKNAIAKNPKDKEKVLKIKYAKGQLQLAMGWIAAIRKKKRRVENSALNENFRKVAKDVLPKEVFENIMSRAKSM